MPDKQQIILITGCSSGIGRALALELARRGHHVVASARKLSAVHDLCEQANIETLEMDVNDVDSIARAVATTISTHQRIDILINNAGFSVVGPLAEVPLGDVRQIFGTNVLGVLAVSQAVIPHMAAARAGRIVNISSMVASLPTPFGGAYCATKAAVHMLCEALRLELFPFGVDVIEVQPGMIRSSIADKATFDPDRYDRPESIYQPLIAAIRRRHRASQQHPTPTEVFARRMVAAVLRKRAPRVVRVGRGAKLFSWLAWVTPGRVQDWALRRAFGLRERLC